LMQRKDVGKIITANIGSQFVSSVLLSNGLGAKLLFRTSSDGVNFSSWLDFQPITTTFRYIDFEVLLWTLDTTMSPEVNIIQETIDVPDTDKFGTTTVSIGGTDVSYNFTYQVNPTVLPTAIGTGLHCELISVGLSDFHVRVINTSNTDVGGTITWLSRGY